ncbi:uncharacterized protein [Physcomitrium patens]|uniref:uncharacterized protein n=1 Tax=Physcomitrium patens TaxID=3218 RepID=UPI000D163D05|nr:uncharacterized protein LOC112273009 isoform X2 [Physcomitrium patens]|eukprot:XP_024357072.1 uncharacterized protein LOC112273009 isoform X2 [Physcomitrella patens]
MTAFVISCCLLQETRIALCGVRNLVGWWWHLVVDIEIENPQAAERCLSTLAHRDVDLKHDNSIERYAICAIHWFEKLGFGWRASRAPRSEEATSFQRSELCFSDFRGTWS